MIKPRKTRQNCLEKVSCIKMYLFVSLRLYVLVNNFSVIFGRFPGFNQYSAMGMKCLAQ